MTTTLERYRDAAMQLLPPGSAFSRALEGNIAAFCEGFVFELARIHDAALELVANVLPSDEAYLADWEEALDITPAGSSVAERVAAARAKLRGQRRYNLAAYEAVANAADAPILQVNRFAPFQIGRSAAGEALYGDGWANVIEIFVDTAEPSEALVAALQALARAHGYVIVRGAVAALGEIEVTSEVPLVTAIGQVVQLARNTLGANPAIYDDYQVVSQTGSFPTYTITLRSSNAGPQTLRDADASCPAHWPADWANGHAVGSGTLDAIIYGAGPRVVSIADAFTGE
jgi:uncharacterized protein YmfQ (DUF2313 family)